MRVSARDTVEQNERGKKKTFPELLRYQRTLRGWSQARLSEEIGVTPNRISSWERGIALPNAYFREKLCTLLQMNAQELGLLAVDPENVASESMADEPVEKSEKPAEKLAEEEKPYPDLPGNNVDEPEHNLVENEPVTPAPPTQPISPDTSFPALHRTKRKRLYWLGALLLPLVLVGGLFLIGFVGRTPSQPTNPYPPYTGQLVLNDALHDQSSGVNWQEGVNDQPASCLFKDGGYVAFQPLTGYFHPCVAQKTDYTNFTYEVQMTIQQGDFGGIVFRAEDSIDSHYYLFRIHTDGSYWLYRYVDRTGAHAVELVHGSVQLFNKGLGKQNRLAVVAQADQLSLYVNGRLISTLQDAGYTHGQIGVLAGSLYNGPAQALFQNVKVWSW